MALLGFTGRWLVAAMVGIVVLIVALVIFFIWLFWTVAGIIMDIGGWTKYGWPLQLVLFLILWSVCEGFGVTLRK